MAVRNNGSSAAQLAALTVEIEHLKQDSREAKEGRATLHRRMDEIVHLIAEGNRVQSETKKTVDDMKPVVEEVRRWKLMGIGALAVVGLGGTALGVGIAGSLEKLAAWLRG